jgi:hypothetical protein
VQLKTTRHRSSKSGDFRAAHNSDPARITVNDNLNPYAFLVTFVHEMAHYQTWMDYQQVKQTFTIRRHPLPQPHGNEWKNNFRQLMRPFLSEKVFPENLLPILCRYLENPKASTSADKPLALALQKYDPAGPAIRLEELPPDAIFSLHGNGKRMFRKKEKLRTRYRCICMKTNRIYLVSGNAPVMPL